MKSILHNTTGDVWRAKVGIGAGAAAVVATTVRVVVLLSQILTSSLFSPSPTMRTQHTAHTIESFPINCAAFLSPTELVLGGGGGNSRSGVKNRLVRRILGPRRPQC
jgi:hypothetical protein